MSAAPMIPREGDGATIWLNRAVLAFALTIPVTVALGEFFAYASLALGALLIATGRLALPGRSPMTWPVVVFLAIALVASLAGARPAYSLQKLDRLLLAGLVFVLPAAWRWPGGRAGGAAERVVVAFLAGCTIQAVCDLVAIPFQFHLKRRDWLDTNPGATEADVLRLLFDFGNMRDPQFYLVATCVLMALLLFRRAGERGPWLWAATAANASALVLHFKRGSWLSFVAAVLVMALMTARRKALLAVVVGCAVLLALPAVRERLGMLEEETSSFLGGRLSLWTRVAPELIAEHPAGMGWKAPRHEDFRAVSRNVMPGLNHLHNNALEILLELGWAGAAAWIWWFGAGVVMSARNVLSLRAAGGREAAIAAGVMGGFTGLLVNGMVEYNFGDAEVFLMMMLLLSIIASQWRAAERAGLDA